MNEAAEIERDAQARLRALAADASFIVQAPAGSGKTELLIQRFLVLLARVQQPEEILAITFTRKAAAEMRARLTRALESAAQSEPAQAHHRQTWRLARAAMDRDRTQGWRLLEHPLRLRVRTVDSFCAGLTRRMPWLSRLGDAPAATDDARALYEEAARNLLRRIFTGEPGADQVECLLRHRGNDLEAVKGLLVDMLACRDQWLRHVLGRCSEDQRHDLERALGEVVTYELKELVRIAPKSLEADLTPLAAFAAAHCPADGKDAPIRRLTDCAALPGAAIEDCELWRALARLLLTDKGAWRKPKGLRIDQGFPAQSQGRDKAEKALFKDRKEQMGVLLTALEGEEDFRSALVRVRSLPPAHYSDDDWALLESLMTLLPQAVAELRLVFSAQGRVDHIEQAMAAAYALGDSQAPSDLALALDYQLRHILMDEFQDTSQSQFRLLERLLEGWEPGDGRSLFLVGDPMQSIYRFREADVGLFLRAKERGVGPVALEYLRLSRNFRSRPGVVDWVNKVFARVMPKAEEPLTGAVAYSPSQAVRTGEGEAVEIHALAGRKQEVERVAELAARALADSEDTVAILVRARGHLPEIVRALRRRELRFQAVDIDPLAERGVIQDLWSLTRALRHRRDRLAWLSVLRAPWAGLRLQDLQALSDGAGERDLPQTLLAFASVEGLSEDARSRLERLAPCIAEALNQVRRTSLRQVVEGLWLRLGGPACYPAAEVAEADRFLDLLSELEEGGDLPDTQAMTRRLEQLYAAPDPQADGRLQIMTLHKAKGLEFGVVILPGLDRGTRSANQKLLVWLERHAGEGGLLAGAIQAQGGDQDPIYRYISQVDKDRDAHETGRLLYVAATRARERLHLLGRIPCKSTETGYEPASPAHGSFLDKLWFVMEDVFRQAMDRLDACESQSGPQEHPQILLQRLPSDWRRPQPPQPPGKITTPAPPALSMDAEAVEFDWARLLTRNAGTVVHRYLKAMAEQGLDRWSYERVEANQTAFRALLEQLGTAPEDLDTALERVVTALHNVLNDERAAWMLGPRERAGCEIALSGLLDGRLIHRIVDRSFVDAGERWIIDYKTGIHEGGSPEGFLHAEEERYREQLQTYGRLYRIMEDRPVRLALYFPLMKAFREIGSA